MLGRVGMTPRRLISASWAMAFTEQRPVREQVLALTETVRQGLDGTVSATDEQRQQSRP